MILLVLALGTLLPGAVEAASGCRPGVSCPMMAMSETSGRGGLAAHEGSPCSRPSFDRGDCCSLDSNPATQPESAVREIDRPNPGLTGSLAFRAQVDGTTATESTAVSRQPRPSGTPLYTLHASLLT